MRNPPAHRWDLGNRSISTLTQTFPCNSRTHHGHNCRAPDWSASPMDYSVGRLVLQMPDDIAVQFQFLHNHFLFWRKRERKVIMNSFTNQLVALNKVLSVARSQRCVTCNLPGLLSFEESMWIALTKKIERKRERDGTGTVLFIDYMFCRPFMHRIFINCGTTSLSRIVFSIFFIVDHRIWMNK